jgi:hypothetical protein
MVAETRLRYVMQVPTCAAFWVGVAFVVASLAGVWFYGTKIVEGLAFWDIAQVPPPKRAAPSTKMSSDLQKDWQLVLDTPVHWMHLTVDLDGLQGEGFFQGNESAIAFQTLSSAFPQTVFYSQAVVDGTGWTRFVLEKAR